MCTALSSHFLPLATALIISLAAVLHPSMNRHAQALGSMHWKEATTVTSFMVLTDFKQSLDNSIALASWKLSGPSNNSCDSPRDTHYCHWVGVTCDSKGLGRVLRLELAGMGLQGTITSMLANLTWLEVLDLSGNSLSGQIPPNLSDSLAILSLSQNHIRGDIPPSLGKLRQLQQLSLDNNWLHGSIPNELANCTQLGVLNLAQNNLTGRIPTVLGEITRLQVLLLWFNSLEGELPASLSNCSELIQLETSINWNIHGSIPQEFGLLKSLKVLRLYQSHLSGTLPETLANCSNLADLSLFSNYLSGEVPPVLGTLSQLQVLNLHNNSFTGPIPPSFGNCSSLTFMDFSINRFSNSIPQELGAITFSGLKTKNLEYNFAGPYAGTFNLRNNSLSGEIPASLGNCSGLRFIYLNFNDLEGVVHQDLGQLQELRELYLTGNRLKGHIPTTFGNLSQLQQLYLNINNLSGSIPEALASIANLSTLDLGSNQLEGSIPADIGSLSALQSLVLLQNQLTGFLPWSLGNCTKLQQLKLSSNALSGMLASSSLTTFSNLQLRVLNLSDNHFSGQFPTLMNLSELYSISLARNQMTGFIPHMIGNLSKVQLLDLSSNRFSGPIPYGITQCINLYALNLGNNALEGPLPSSLGNLTSLRRLYLQGNALNDSIPDSIGNCKSLEDVDLSHNNLTGAIPTSLFALPSLEFSLSLAHNFLTGPIPYEVGKMTLLQNLDLSVNNLTGAIPESVADCISFQHLNLSNNGLNGSIPTVLGKLSNLVDLDLSSNFLSGHIPMEVSALQGLKFINVSNNQLVGTIPTSPAFSHLTAASFSGNAGLCGTPLPVSCPGTSAVNHLHARARFKALLAAVIGCVSALPVLLCCLLWYYWMCYRLLLISSTQSTKFLPEDLFEANLFRVTADELYIATDGYSENNLIGIGGSSKVYKGILPDGRCVAVKKFNLEDNHEEAKSIFDKECETLGKIRHRNLVPILSTCCNLEIKALVLEFMPNGNLEQHLFGSETHGLQWERVFQIAVDVANALVYLHHECSVPVLHCDLKPSNILLDGDFTAHVADFGIAQLLTPNTTTYSATHFRGSIGYAAPECAELSHYSTKGDVYSYGVVLLCMLTRKPPTSDLFDNGMDLPKWVQAFLPERFLEALHPTLRAEVEAAKCEKEAFHLLKLALMCTQRAPSDRPTSRQTMDALLNSGLRHPVSVKMDPEQDDLRKSSYHLSGESSSNTS